MFSLGLDVFAAELYTDFPTRLFLFCLLSVFFSVFVVCFICALLIVLCYLCLHVALFL